MQKMKTDAEMEVAKTKELCKATFATQAGLFTSSAAE